MAYYDGEILAVADSESTSERDLKLQIPVGVMDELSMPDKSDWYFGQTGGEVRVELTETSGYVKCGATEIQNAQRFEHDSSHQRWTPDDFSFGKETYVYQGNVIKPGEDIIDALGINSTELNNVRWTVDTDNWRCVLTKVVK